MHTIIVVSVFTSKPLVPYYYLGQRVYFVKIDLHQDTYYLDSEQVGKMTAAWLALEEIKADAGRFFICPETHKIDLNIYYI